MSFRVEKKIETSNFQQKIILNEIIKLGARKIFPERKINSIYFENKENRIFNDSEEGICPRKKIRIRNYNDLNNFNLEIKISSIEGNFKKSKKISVKEKDDYIKLGFIDDLYGICSPIISVAYIRSYYILNKTRITIDENINYFKYNSNLNYYEKSGVVEFKSENEDFIEEFQKKIPFITKRYSKYCRGFKILINNDFF